MSKQPTPAAIKVKRPPAGRKTPASFRFGNLPRKPALALTEGADKWLRARLDLFIPGPSGIRLNEGVIHVHLSDARKDREALRALVHDGLVETSLLDGALRVRIGYDRLVMLVSWAKLYQRTKPQGQKKSILANRPEFRYDRTDEVAELERWLADPPETAKQMSLFR